MITFETNHITCIENMLEIHNKDIDFRLYRNIMKEIHANPYRADDILDSVSVNQVIAKTKLLEQLTLNNTQTVGIFGSWYGSILIPKLADKVKEIKCWDINVGTMKISQSIFEDLYDNIQYIPRNPFEIDFKTYKDLDILINTSCENMMSMKDWPYWRRLKPGCIVALQSHNILDIHDSYNCVNSINEFRNQLPPLNILHESEIEDSRGGSRFTIIGSTIEGYNYPKKI